MRKHHRKDWFILPITLTSQNRWAKRGRNLAHFIMSLVIGLSAYLGDLVIAIFGGLFHLIFRHKRKVIGKACPKGTAPDQPEQFLPIIETPDVTFEDIAGLEKAKEQIYQRMILPTLYPKEAEALKVKLGGGFLLFGPPGTGKTMLAKAVAHQVKASFFNLQPAKLMSGNVGEAEKRLHFLFQIIKRYQRAVLFFDDMDGLFPARFRTKSTIMQRFLPQFLIETDGVESASSKNVILMIGATNEPWMVDPAVIRPGRFDVPIYVGLPEEPARLMILQKQLHGRLIAPDINLSEIVSLTQGYSGSDMTAVVDRAAQKAFSRNIRRGKEEALSPMSHQDFLEALQDVKPSVSKDYLRRYDEYLESFSR